MSSKFFVLRQLTGSELGWFASARQRGLERGRQRGINFNAAEMERMFPPDVLVRGEITLSARRWSDGQVHLRSLRKQQKNWRLVGPQVSGPGLEGISEGDYFWAVLDCTSGPPFVLTWDVVTRSAHESRFGELVRRCPELVNRMIAVRADDCVAIDLMQAIGVASQVSSLERELSGAAGAPVPVEEGHDGEATPIDGDRNDRSASSSGHRPHPKSKATGATHKRIGPKLEQPHIIVEILKGGLALSVKAQSNYLEVLDTLASTLRDLLLDGKLLRRVEINHKKTWSEFRGVQIGFVDGGVANISAPGAAPVAIRVGSYVVVPGREASNREEFDFEVQLVDELYESPAIGSGVYEDYFEDVAKLRDAARMACETAGVIRLTLRGEPPDIIFLHGPLVNPVSPYAIDGFPNFTQAALAKLLPHDTSTRTGRDANFAVVYRDQLDHLRRWGGTVCGIVERATARSPGLFALTLIEHLRNARLVDGATEHEFLQKLREYRITDTVLFECVLEEGEYVTPLVLDKQGPDHKIPDDWKAEITSYPKPLATYSKPSVSALPVRAEYFHTGVLREEELIGLIVHMSRLLPTYNFPVGLDIVDKHARIPNWMSREISALLAARLFCRAMVEKNEVLVRGVRRLLGTSPRDWLFRPRHLAE